MKFTQQQLWREVFDRLHVVENETKVSEQQVDALLNLLPRRLPKETLMQWFIRGQGLINEVYLPQVDFHSLTEFNNLAASSSLPIDELLQKPRITNDKQFRLSVLDQSELQLTLKLEALGRASFKYANCLMGIAAQADKDDLIAVLKLDEDGEGSVTVGNNKSIQYALLEPIIALIESYNA